MEYDMWEQTKGLLEEQDNKQDPDMTKPQPCTKFRGGTDSEMDGEAFGGDKRGYTRGIGVLGS